MKRTVLLLFFGIFFICDSSAKEELRIMESRVMPSRILKQDVHFSVYLPKNYYNTKEVYPVVYLLHGLGDNETSWLEYGRISQFADKAIENKQAVPMIFVMPEGFRTYYVNDVSGTFLYQDMFVKELVPYIDSLFRTKADSRHRTLMGYSMGGFGALTLHLKYPDLFGAAVPLSVSIRTDEQYMTEDSGEWDQQWGRLFGGQGLTGDARVTSYYKENCPFYQLKQMKPADYGKLKIYLVNGDKEQTLCRSNEELHILMRSLKIPHEYRVRDGGHSFGYWCSAIPDALSFLSASFEINPYQSNIPIHPLMGQFSEKQVRKVSLNKDEAFVCVPDDYNITDRLYPVIYIAGSFTSGQRDAIASCVNLLSGKNEITEMLLVFLPPKSLPDLISSFPGIEKKMRIREGYRFRALLGFQDEADQALSLAMNQQQFRVCFLADPFLSKESVTGTIKGKSADSLKRVMFYIDTPDKGNYFEGNGNAHMLLRDAEIIHEYRVRDGNGGFEWFLMGLPELVSYASNNFHK